MGLPVEVLGFEAEVGPEEVVLDDIGVLAGHQLEDLLDRIEVPAPVVPRATVAVGSRWQRWRLAERRVGRFPVKLEEERCVGGWFDLVVDTRSDDGLVAGAEALVPGIGPRQLDVADRPGLHVQHRPDRGPVDRLQGSRQIDIPEHRRVPTMDEIRREHWFDLIAHGRSHFP